METPSPSLCSGGTDASDRERVEGVVTFPEAPLPPSGYSPQRSLRSLGGETAHFVRWGEKWGETLAAFPPPGAERLFPPPGAERRWGRWPEGPEGLSWGRWPEGPDGVYAVRGAGGHLTTRHEGRCGSPLATRAAPQSVSPALTRKAAI